MTHAKTELTIKTDEQMILLAENFMNQYNNMQNYHVTEFKHVYQTLKTLNQYLQDHKKPEDTPYPFKARSPFSHPYP